MLTFIFFCIILRMKPILKVPWWTRIRNLLFYLFWRFPNVIISAVIKWIFFVNLHPLFALILRPIKITIGPSKILIHSSQSFMHLFFINFSQSTQSIFIEPKTCGPFKMFKSIIFKFVFFRIKIFLLFSSF